ncbi:hypothetical protein [Nonomuraea sp. NPDC050643]|uniref:hypothetical protein n=1 Tax=Nonomuraea sp. NPDC050643 TaxID=3155660 RepID=UPI0033C3059F
MADISYLEAWRMWFDGKSTVGNNLLGVPMLWWGRTGKIGAFLGGMTVVLDVIGPERIRQFGERVRRVDPWADLPEKWLRVPSMIIWLIGAVPFGISAYVGGGSVEWTIGVPMLVCYVAIAFAVVNPDALAKLAAMMLENPVSERILRWIAVVLLIVGFHFDLLAS